MPGFAVPYYTIYPIPNACRNITLSSSKPLLPYVPRLPLAPRDALSSHSQLANRIVQSNGARAVVLEIVESQRTSGTELECNSLTSTASVAADNIAVSRLNAGKRDVETLRSWCVVVG